MQQHTKKIKQSESIITTIHLTKVFCDPEISVFGVCLHVRDIFSREQYLLLPITNCSKQQRKWKKLFLTSQNIPPFFKFSCILMSNSPLLLYYVVLFITKLLKMNLIGIFFKTKSTLCVWENGGIFQGKRGLFGGCHINRWKNMPNKIFLKARKYHIRALKCRMHSMEGIFSK